MTRFIYDFAGFVLGAALCALPACAVIRFATLAEARAHQPESTRALDMPRMSGGARAVPPSGGDLRRPTAGKPSKRAGLTGENRTPPSSARSSSLLHAQRGLGEAVMASAQGLALLPRPMKSQLRLSDSGSTPDASTIRGGAPVSTGDGGATETAEARGLANQPETNKRQLRVADGGLTAPEDAGSPRHRNQPYLYEVTAYSHGCTLPRSGREPIPQRAANGRWPIADLTVAADTRIHPFGSEVLIEGLGFRLVHDRGAAIVGRRLDLFVDSCREARRFGRRWLRVYTVPRDTTRYADIIQGSAQ